MIMLMIPRGRQERRSTLLTNGQVQSLQSVIMHWVRHCGNVDFLHSRKVVENAAISLGIDLSNSSHAEYEVIFPLYQLGILEYGMTENGARLFPCESKLLFDGGCWSYLFENHAPRYVREDGFFCTDVPRAEDYFMAMPTLRACILGWSQQQVANLRYRFDYKHHQFKVLSDPISCDGIYKQADEVWVDAYFHIDNSDYRIPSHYENPEAFRIAKSYGMATKGIKLFSYSEDTLICCQYLDLPIPVVRGLFIASPDNLGNELFYHPSWQMRFEGISKAIVMQLERIFSTSIL